MVGWRAIAGQDELAAALVKRVEGVEELLLGLHLVREELNVVDEEDVHAAEAVAEAGRVAGLQRTDEVRGERLDGGVAHAQAGAIAMHVVADGVKEVCLAETRR